MLVGFKHIWRWVGIGAPRWTQLDLRYPACHVLIRCIFDICEYSPCPVYFRSPRTLWAFVRPREH